VVATGAIADCPGLTIFGGNGIQNETDGGHLRAPASPAPAAFERGIVLSGEAACLEETLGWHGSLPLTWTLVDAVLKSEYVFGGNTTRLFSSGRLELRDAADVLVLTGRVSGLIVSWSTSTHSGSFITTADFLGGTLFSALALRNGIIVSALLSDVGDATGWNAAVALDVMYPPYARSQEPSAPSPVTSTWGRMKAAYQ
jgi:hypothetical protein